MKTFTFVGAGIVALALAAGAFLAPSSWRKPAAPSVAYTLLDGSRGTIGGLRGKVVLVNFWATDCAPCVKDMPQFVATHERFKARGLQTLAVAMSYDPPMQVIRFAESRQLPFGVVIDNTGAFAKGFDQIQATPTTVLVNRRGEIVGRFIGEPDFPSLNALVDKLLLES